MKLTKITSVIVFLAVLTLIFSGCVSQEQYEDLKLKNRTQTERIAELESELSSLNMQRQQLMAELSKAEQLGGVDTQELREELMAVEKALAAKNALIKRMQGQLLKSGSPLPMELNVLLSEFADKNSEMVSFDESTGMLKFKSDLLFAPGSDVVQTDAAKALTALADIMESDQAGQFDVVIAGHTDNVPIGKPSTRAKHPTNWHLSAHRAIGVVKILQKNGVAPTRLSARGFGQYRPVAPNKGKNRGNSANRRVEIFIVPKGM